jgi:hypothetical protein
LIEQQSVQLIKDTYRQAADHLADIVAIGGPLVTREVGEDKFPGQHPSALGVRQDIVSFVGKYCDKPIPIPKTYLHEPHALAVNRSRLATPQFMVVRSGSQLELVYVSGEEQIYVPVLYSRSTTRDMLVKYGMKNLTAAQADFMHALKKVNSLGITYKVGDNLPPSLYGFKTRQT